MDLSRRFKLVLLLGSVFLSGCVGLGVGVLGDNERNISNPHIRIEKGIVGRTEGAAPWITGDDLLRYWGPPDSIERTAQGDAQWQYNFGRRWNGVGLLVAFIPLPLLMPVGHEYILFTINQGLVVKATTKEDDWIAMYGCLISAIAHAQGSDCVFGREAKETRFVGDVPLFKIRVINATNGAVSVARTDKEHGRVSQAPPFTLGPRESRNILDHFLGEIAVKNAAGKTLSYAGREAPKAYAADAAVAYLIIDDHVFPIPPTHWDNWESQLKEFTSSGGSKP